MKIAVIAQVVQATGPLAKTGTVAITTAMACLDLIRMMIMIFDGGEGLKMKKGSTFPDAEFCETNQVQSFEK